MSYDITRPLPLAGGPVELQKWLVEQMPRDGDRVDECYMRLGMALSSVLGASLDLLSELRAERERLRAIR